MKAQLIAAAAQRIRTALKAGKEIDVFERGGNQIMTAYEHPPVTDQLTDLNAVSTNKPDLNTKKAKCYWYWGEVKQTAVFNVENLEAIYSLRE